MLFTGGGVPLILEWQPALIYSGCTGGENQEWVPLKKHRFLPQLQNFAVIDSFMSDPHSTRKAASLPSTFASGGGVRSISAAAKKLGLNSQNTRLTP